MSVKHILPFCVALGLSSWTMQARATHPCFEDAGPCDCCHGTFDCPPSCFDSGAAGVGGSATGGAAGSATGGAAGSATGGSGGTPGSGGTAGGAGSAGSAEDDGGCGCRIVPRSNDSVWVAITLAGLCLLRRRRARIL